MSDYSVLMLSMSIYKAVSIFAGLAFAFMGYKLFVQGIFQVGGELHTNWENRALVLKKAAPGTFFAFFGTLIVCIALWRGLYIGPNPRVAAGAPGPGGAEEQSLGGSGFFGSPGGGGRAPQDPAAETARRMTRDDVAALNRFADDVLRQRQQKKGGDSRVTVTVEDVDGTLDLVDRAKAALMLSVWSPDWGDREVFRKWASHNYESEYPYAEPPERIARAAEIFKGKAQ